MQRPGSGLHLRCIPETHYGWASPTISSSGSPRRTREVASTCPPRRAMGAAILASTPPASAPTSRLFTRWKSQATRGDRGFESVSLLHGVCLTGAFRGAGIKARRWRGVSLDETRERDVLATSRLALATFL